MVAKKRAGNRKKNLEKRLPWEYCECGCKGHAVSLGPVHYWMFNDLHEPPKFHLVKGHGFVLGERLSDHPSFEDADCAARLHAKPLLEQYKAELQEGLRAIEAALR